MNISSSLFYKTLCTLLLGCVLGVGSLKAQRGQFTVVIDAGHGGKDPGAMAHGYKEKDIALAVALKTGSKIKANHPNVRVLYTRDRDVFVGLQARSDFANRHKASLFISIHLNSSTSGSAYGTETYVIGMNKQSNNLNVAMRENKAMLLESDYKTTYRGFDPTNAESYIIFDLMQEAYINRSIDIAKFVERQYKNNGRTSRGVRQEGLWVLSQSAMPSILTEIGFISNANDAAYLGSESGQEEVAGAISRAFTKFYDNKSKVGREHSTADSSEQTAPAEVSSSSSRSSQRNNPTTKTEKKESEGQHTFRVQFMTDRTKIDTSDKQFRSLHESIYREQSGKVWLYLAGKFSKLEEAKSYLQTLKKKYPDAFIVRYDRKTGERLGRI
jgi:N-acetylmuramoyl-L-alanine amidase, family 3